jgi:transposase
MILTVFPVPYRFARPPWTTASPEYLALDQQLDPDHKARIIDDFVDHLDLTELVATYRGSGSEAHPPDVMLKIALAEALEGHLSPAQWKRHLRDHLPLQWLARGIRPSRSAFYAFRDRLGFVIDAVLADLIIAAKRQGYVHGQLGVLDGTSVRAQASRHRLLNQPRLLKRFAALQEAVGRDAAGQEVSQPPGWMAATADGRRAQLERYRRAQAELERRLAENAKKAKDRRLPAEKVMISVSDPEAPLGRDKEYVFCPLYTVEYVIEPCSLLIVAFDVFARATDAGTLPPMIDQAQRGLEQALETMITDAGYVSVLDLRACAERRIELIAPVQENDSSQAKAKARTQAPEEAPIGKDQFTWDPAEQTYRCPQGHTLKRIRQHPKPRRQGESVVMLQYQCPGQYCQECPLKQRCVKDPSKGRIVGRVAGEEILEEHRQKMTTPRAQTLRKLRGQVIERGFGDAKQHRNLRKLHGRGRHRAKAEVGLVVLAQNALMLHRLSKKAVNPVKTAA